MRLWTHLHSGGLRAGWGSGQRGRPLNCTATVPHALPRPPPMYCAQVLCQLQIGDTEAAGHCRPVCQAWGLAQGGGCSFLGECS